MKKIISFIMVISLLCVFTACSNGESDSETTVSTAAATAQSTQTTTQPQETAWEWQKDTPDNQGLNSSALPDIHATFDSFNLLSSVIVKNGYIVDEYYKDGYDETSEFILNSASKSVTSALVGIAIDQGYIESVDTLISRYLPQVSELGDGWNRITIRHLLTHTSGISTTDDVLWNEWRSSDNWLDYIFNLPIVSEPGQEFSYSTGNTHLLCAILQEATGMTADAFAREYLFDPVGMDSAAIASDPQEISDGGNGVFMNIYDMAKFGLLYLNGGIWQGEQIVPAQWVEDSTSVQYDRSTGSADYGYQWWVRTFGDQGYDAYFAQGHAGQYIFVVPEIELIVAFTSDYEGSTGIYWQLVNDIVNACLN